MKERIDAISFFIKRFKIPYDLIGKEMGYRPSYLSRIFSHRAPVTKKFYLSLEYWLKNYQEKINKEIDKIFLDEKIK